MSAASSRAFRVSAVLGFLAVALGAFGAHGLKDAFAARPGARDTWETAVLYHAIHALAMFVLAGLQPWPEAAWGLFGAGVVLFSGSLYLLALTGAHWLGFVTPLGGLCFLAGWLWLAVRPPLGWSRTEGGRP